MGGGDPDTIYNEVKGSLGDMMINTTGKEYGVIYGNGIPSANIDDKWYYIGTELINVNTTKEYIWCKSPDGGSKAPKVGDETVYVLYTVWKRVVVHPRIKCIRINREV